MIAKILLAVPETPEVALAMNSSAFALISLEPLDEDVVAFSETTIFLLEVVVFPALSLAVYVA